MWNDQHICVIQGTLFNRNDYLHDSTPYMQWNIDNTIHFISLFLQSSDNEASLFLIDYLFINHIY